MHPPAPVPLWPPPPPPPNAEHHGRQGSPYQQPGAEPQYQSPSHPPPSQPPPGHLPGWQQPGWQQPGWQQPGWNRQSTWQQTPGWHQPQGQPGDPNRYPYGIPGLRPAPLDAKGRPLASWLKRVFAMILDFFFLSLVLNWLGHEAFPLVANATNLATAPKGQVASFFGVILLVWLGYLSFFASSRRGQTLGMMIYGIAVRDETSGDRVAIVRATLRSLIIVVFCGFLVDLLWPLWDNRRQSLHDKAARTVVVDVRLAALAQRVLNPDR